MRRVLAIAGTVAIGLLSSAVAAQAEVVSNITAPFAAVVFVPCANAGAGELVDLSGNLHAVITLTVEANNVSGVAHFQPQGVRGVGEATGDVYEGTGVTRQHFTTSLQGDHAESSFVNSFQIIGRGGAGNFRVHQASHVTITAGGEVTAAVDNVRVDCS